MGYHKDFLADQSGHPEVELLHRVRRGGCDPREEWCEVHDDEHACIRAGESLRSQPGGVVNTELTYSKLWNINHSATNSYASASAVRLSARKRSTNGRS